MIRLQRIDGEEEKQLVRRMVTNDKFLKEIEPMYDPSLLRSPATRRVASWVMEYFKTYSKAPMEKINEIFRGNEDTLQEDETKAIELLLSGIETEPDSGIEYATDKAELYFKARSLERLRDNITRLLSAGVTLDAEASVAKYRRVERPISSGIDVLNDRKSVYQAFQSYSEKRLFSFPGVLGDTVGPLVRGDLHGVAAPMKRGKTWWLLYIAALSLLNGFRTLFVSLEMTEDQMIQRIYQFMLGQTLKEKQIELPYFCELDDDPGRYEVLKKMVQKEGLSFSMAMAKAARLKVQVKNGTFMLQCFAAHSISSEDIENYIINMENYKGTMPDVVVIDYADILKPENDSPRDYRHRIDHTWKNLRRIAQQYRCAVVTGTQTTRGTLTKDVDQDDIAEDIRKLAHVAWMVSLNQGRNDKRNGIMRVAMLASRHDEFYVDDEVVVLQQMAMGRPYLDSKKKKDVDL